MNDDHSYLLLQLELWNNLPTEIETNPSISNCKRFLNKDKHVVPQYYNQGTRNEQILHAKLRMGCSTNFAENPSSCCGEIESTEHFLLKCLQYTHLRNAYL
jgi:hypothetical protein